jgi:hypothetical protein
MNGSRPMLAGCTQLVFSSTSHCLGIARAMTTKPTRKVLPNRRRVSTIQKGAQMKRVHIESKLTNQSNHAYITDLSKK